MKMLAFDLGASSGKLVLGGFNGKTLDLKEITRLIITKFIFATRSFGIFLIFMIN